MSVRRSFVAALATIAGLVAAAGSMAHDTKPGTGAVQTQAMTLSIPDVQVQDQNGRTLDFYRDLVKGKTVAINFIFTTCEAVCPVTTAVMRDAQAQTMAKSGVQFVSISVDPETDRPAVLGRYAARYQAQPGWAFVTGDRAQIEKLLKAFGVAAANKNDHTPLVYVGNDRVSEWTRISGLAPASQLVRAVEQADAKGRARAPAAETPTSAAAAAAPSADADADGARYFTNLPLITQDKRAVRFYDDMIKNQVVLINVMFAGCSSVCSAMTSNLARVQELLRSDATRYHMVSITVDPLNDTPEALKAYAEARGAKEGWTFLTGSKQNIDWVLYKLGNYAKEPMEHSNILLIGNDAAGVWTKALAMDKPAEIAAAARKVASAR
jgi:protein SCO1